MPTFDVTIEGKTYHVQVPDPGASPLQVIVDGEPFMVEVGDSTLADGKPTVTIGAPHPAPVPAPLPVPRSVAAARPVVSNAPVVANGGHDILAPMPGTVLTVEVQSGDVVESGQVVCVLEAMKMKNPIRAAFGGTVSDIAVRPGQTVAHGELMLRIA